MARVSARADDASDATAAVVKRQAEHRVRPPDWRPLPVGRPLEEVVAEAENALVDPS